MTRPSGKRLLVPVGGPGLGWSLLARYGLLISISFFVWAIPLPKVAGWFGLLENPVRSLTLRLLSPMDDALGQLFYRWVVPAIIAALWLALDRKRKHEVAIMEVARVMARHLAVLSLPVVRHQAAGRHRAVDSGAGFHLPILTHRGGTTRQFLRCLMGARGACPPWETQREGGVPKNSSRFCAKTHPPTTNNHVSASA